MVLSNLRVVVSSTLIIFSVLFPLQSSGDTLITSNTLTRVFMLGLGDKIASSFTIEVKGKQYLITARHFMDEQPEAKFVRVFKNSKWESLPIRRIEVQPKEADIAVLALTQQFYPVFPIDMQFNGTSLSEQVFFLGFPLGLSIDGKSLNSGFPLPIVKRGIVASIPSNDGEPFYIDGMNNKGMSGGLVVRSSSVNSPVIIGVISGYANVESQVCKQNDLRCYKSDKSDLVAVDNSGLVIAYPINYAIMAIEKDSLQTH